jgi:alkylhydroperoxidase/carboxymuconolactone decarboxylase family protein YurZ
VPGRFAAAKQAGATEDEISEALYYAMRGAARATWSTIKHIPGIEDVNKQWHARYEREGGK